MEIGALIRRARLGEGLSQADLAQRSATSQEAISAYERGRKDPTTATVSRILAAVGWSLIGAPSGREVWTPTAAELERRGRVLAQVIDLAERLPGKERGRLGYPPMRKPAGQVEG